MSWKPIESAPKDGTSIILLIDGSVIEGQWLVTGYRPKGIWEVVTLDSHGCGCCSDNNSDPTHWMPLPEPPK